ncbi:MAG: type I methionyl aminopeptidase, partial [Bryobacteraceae bacterium]
MIIRKSPAELEKMRRSGLLVYRVLHAIAELVADGVTTMDLENAAARMIADAGARPAFKGYFSAAAGNRYPF